MGVSDGKKDDCEACEKMKDIGGSDNSSDIQLSAADLGGGIADRPGNMPDPFHTFFGLAGLSLLTHKFQDLEPLLSHGTQGKTADKSCSRLKSIDPVYALPVETCDRLKLPKIWDGC